MKTDGLFFLDVLSIMPENNTYLYIQASDAISEKFLLLTSATDEPALRQAKCDKKTKKVLEDEVSNNDITDFFQYISIKHNGKTIFEGFDGLEYGVFSKDFIIPNWFCMKYEQDDRYTTSLDW